MVTLLQRPKTFASDVRVNAAQMKIVRKRMQVHIDFYFITGIHEAQDELRQKTNDRGAEKMGRSFDRSYLLD